MRVACAVCFFYALPFISFSQTTDSLKLDPICISATKSETKLREIGSSVTLIDQAEIEAKQSRTVLDALRNHIGLDVVQTGGPGQKASVFIRGANSEHTLVMVDGIIMNDPMSTGRTFNFASLTTENLERIEILRGPQSTLYGSDAMGGVINIISKKGRGKPVFSLSAEAGSFNTFTEKAAISGSTNALNYSLGVIQDNSKGISAASSAYGNKEPDGYANSSFLGRFGLNILDKCNASVTVKADKLKSDLDNMGGASGDDPNNRMDIVELFVGPQVALNLFDNKWSQEFNLAYSLNKNTNNNSPDSVNPIDSLNTTYKGEIVKAEWKNRVSLISSNTILAGFELRKETGSSNNFYRSLDWIDPSKYYIDISKMSQSSEMAGGYLQSTQSIARCFFGSLGVRFDNNTNFGSQLTYRATAAYWIEQVHAKIKSTWGTGFKVPSLFQRYSPYGDTTLKPERSTGFDGGVEQFFLNDKVSLELTGFYNNYKNLIDFNNATYTYSNVDSARIKGCELNVTIKPFENISFSLNRTFTDTKDLITQKPLLERPRLKEGACIDYRPYEALSFHSDIMYIGARTDYPDVQMPEYYLVNIAGSYSINPHCCVFGRIDNLMDARYEVIKGYGTPGISGYGGVKFTY